MLRMVTSGHVILVMGVLLAEKASSKVKTP